MLIYNQYFGDAGPEQSLVLFVIGQVKFLKNIVFTYLVLNSMLHYSLYIYPVVFTYKTCQNIFFFSSKTDIFTFRYILGNAGFALS